MKLLYAIVAVLALAGVAVGGWAVPSLRPLAAIAVPYAAMVAFLAGISWRVVRWSASPVPFRIPTTSGQQRSLPWIRSNRLDNPHSTAGVIGRMLLEVLLFRSLFRNTKAELRPGPRLIYGEEKYLWLAAIAFHWSFLFIFLPERCRSFLRRSLLMSSSAT
jgi:nitrate reductase gamma subunit